MGMRRVWADKTELLRGGAEVEALSYSRASQDKKEQGKSVKDQGRLNRSEIERNGWAVGREYVDNNLSASRYARKQREDYQEMLDAIRAGRGDVLVFFELSRSQRDLAVYVEIRELCVRSGLYFWDVGGQLYDLRNRADRMSLGFQAVQAEDLSEYIRENVKRGIDGAAIAGRPHGKLTYGYRRIYDDRTGAFLEQVENLESRTAVSRDGVVSKYSTAGVVREIFDRLDAGVPISALEADFNARGVLAPAGGRWRRGTIRRIALNPAYIGRRVLRGEVVGDGAWEGLVAEELYWSVNARLNKPERTTTKPGRARWLLSHLGTCAECGGPMSAETARKGVYPVPVYRCHFKRCSSIPVQVLDAFVESTLVAWLSRPDVYGVLAAAFGASDEEVASAHTEIKQLEAAWEKWLKDASAEGVKAATVARFEADHDRKVTAARQRAAAVTLPAALRDVVGPDAAQKWAQIEDVATKREIIRTVTTVAVTRALKRDNVPVEDRVIWGGLIGAQTTA